ncbi:hypothetical protein HYU07_06515 [Candidatus Woesearchaeota archaeon]|nr:hypothetical protein [Candidatus Woesearchaeota archaeon]
MKSKEARKELGEIVRVISELDRTKLGGKIKDNRLHMDIVVLDHPLHVFSKRKGKQLYFSIMKNEPSVYGYVYLGEREKGKHDFHLSFNCSIIKSVESLVPKDEIKTLDLNGYEVEMRYFRSLARF